MKIRIKNTILVFIFMMIINSIGYATVYHPPFPNGELVFNVDEFPLEYASSYILINNSHKSSSSKLTDDGTYIGAKELSAKNTSAYVDHYNSAWMNGVPYDIREYPYACDTSGCIKISTGAMHRKVIGGKIYREFHFYESGHCGEPEYEVEFKGIIKVRDVDEKEIFGIYGGALVNCYLADGTVVTTRSDGHSWTGTIDASDPSTGDDFDSTPRAAVWATVHSTPDNPMILYYRSNIGTANGISINLVGCNINYNIVSNGTEEPPISGWTTMVVEYGQFKLNQRKNVDNYTFSGWYWDSELTDKVNEDELRTTTSDITVYGAYTHGSVNIIDKQTVDVTGAVTDNSSSTSHICTNNIAHKYDGTYHWDECSVCSTKYIKAGRPNDSAIWANSYLEIKQNGNGQRVLVIKNSLMAHNFTNEYWTMGDSCHSSNKYMHICSCGYSYSTPNTREHNLADVYALHNYAASKACLVCREYPAEYVHECYNSNGYINCTNLGTCSKCGHLWSNCWHRCQCRKETLVNNELRCSYCNKKVGTLVEQTWTNMAGYTGVVFRTVYDSEFGNIEPYSYQTFLSKTVGDFETTHTFVNGRITMETTLTYSGHLEEKFYLGHPYYIQIASDEWALVHIYPYDKPVEANNPTISSVTQNDSAIINGWITDSNIIVEGTEDYCNSVTVQMIDATNNSIVCSKVVSVINNYYSTSLTPNITVGEEPKNYIIRVMDSFGNSTSETVTISRYDKIQPVIDKTDQVYTYQGQSMWSTTIPWSKSKDFNITATDESTDIAQIRIQNVTSSKTNVTFEDTEGTTLINNSTSPNQYTRDYTFTGDVKGYVTLLATAKDYAGNETSEFFRVYNLDNTAPYVTGTPVVDVVNKKFTATLADAGSGIKYFGLVPYLGGDVVYPATYESAVTTTASDRNKWYPVALISANATTGEPEHGPSSINVELKVNDGGSYAIIIEDYVGNRYSMQVSIEGIDNTPPDGAISVRNAVTLYTDKEAVNTRNVMLDIVGQDNNSGVDKMAIINQEDIPTSNLANLWENFATEKAWTLTDGDGEKVIYLILSDKSCNITAVPSGLRNEIIVTLNPQGGTGGTSSVTVNFAQAMPTATMPTKAGHSFKGYFDTNEATGGNQYYTDAGASARNWDKLSNTILYARWTANTYTVTLNQKSGSGGTSNVTATYGSAMPSATMPTRTGYTFQGYYDVDATTGGNQYYTNAGASARSWDKTSDTTLYARWTANTNTVTLNQNNGSGGTTSVTATYAQAMPSATMPTRAGYDFQGYYDTNAATGGNQYYTSAGASARNWDKTSNTTLYARWTPITNTVTLNQNNGSGGTTSVTATYAQAMPSATMPTRTGYDFQGYYDTNAATGGNQYYTSAGASAQNWNKTSDTTLYARWKAKTYTVTLNQNNGSGGTTSVTATYGSAMPTATMPTRTGYNFQGYYDTNAASGGNQYYTSAGASAQNWNKTSNTTLYARWSEKTATLSYDAKGHGTAPASVTMKYTAAQNAASAITGVTGYTFSGWNTKSDLSGTNIAAGGQVKAANVVPTATTLYAKWTEKTATLSYDAKGHGTAPSSVTMKYSAAQNAASAITGVTGYTFGGWNTKSDMSGTTIAAGGQVKAANVEPTATTLYAKWTANKYTITYKDVGGGNFTGTHASGYPTQHTYGTATTLKTASRSGYTFNGWFTASNGSGSAVTSLGATAYTGNITLYAKWTANSYTLSYNTKGGYVSTTANTIASQTTTTGSVTISSLDPQLRRYDFRGWSTTENGSVQYQPGETITISSNTTLYAQYTSRLFQSQANAPVLGTGMRAVYWTDDNGGGQTTSTSFNTSMYNYNIGNGLTDSKTTKWANAVTLDSYNNIDAYWVWIPRYAYRIVYYQDANRRRRSDVKTQYGDTEVVFLNGTSNNSYLDSSGSSKTINNSSGYSYKYKNASNNWVTLNSSDGWIIHPAFQKMTTTDTNNRNPLGKWDTELKGLWIAKYEASQERSTNSGRTWSTSTTTNNANGSIATSTSGTTRYRIAVKPGVRAWTYVYEHYAYINSKNMKPSLNSHQMKNSEWGAVAYLAYSPYGRNGEEVACNQSNEYTGAGPGDSSNLYGSTYNYSSSYGWNTTQGKKASTTGNIYGIYDLVGSAWEYTASYVNSGHSRLTSTYYCGNLGTETNMKYKQVYPYSSAQDAASQYNLAISNNIYGDAIMETSTSSNSGYDYVNWCNDCSSFVSYAAPIFCRGGSKYDTYLAGLFCAVNGWGGGSYYNNSDGYEEGGFRVVLAVN